MANNRRISLRLDELSKPRAPAAPIIDEERICGIGSKNYRAVPFIGSIPTTKFDTSDGSFGVGQLISIAAPYPCGYDDIGGIREGEEWEHSLNRCKDLRIPSNVNMHEIRRFFLEQDLDRDGRISIDDIIRVNKKHNVGLSKRTIRAMFEDILEHRSSNSPPPQKLSKQHIKTEFSAHDLTITDNELAANFKPRRRFDIIVTLLISIDRKRKSESCVSYLSGGCHFPLAHLISVIEDVCNRMPSLKATWNDILTELPLFEDNSGSQTSKDASVHGNDSGTVSMRESMLSGGSSFFASLMHASDVDHASPEFSRWMQLGRTNNERRSATLVGRVAAFFDVLGLGTQFGDSWGDSSLPELQQQFGIDSLGIGNHEVSDLIRLQRIKQHIENLLLSQADCVDAINGTKSFVELLDDSIDRDKIESKLRVKQTRILLMTQRADRCEKNRHRAEVISNFIASGGEFDDSSEVEEEKSPQNHSKRDIDGGFEQNDANQSEFLEGDTNKDIVEHKESNNSKTQEEMNIRQLNMDVDNELSAATNANEHYHVIHPQESLAPPKLKRIRSNSSSSASSSTKSLSNDADFIQNSAFPDPPQSVPQTLIPNAFNKNNNSNNNTLNSFYSSDGLRQNNNHQSLAEVDARWVREGDCIKISIKRPRLGWLLTMRTFSAEWGRLLERSGYSATVSAPPLPSKSQFPHPDIQFSNPERYLPKDLASVETRLHESVLSAKSPTLALRTAKANAAQDTVLEAPEEELAFYQYLKEKLESARLREALLESNPSLRYMNQLPSTDDEVDTLTRIGIRKLDSWANYTFERRIRRFERGELNVCGFGLGDNSIGVNSSSLIPNYPSTVTYSSNDQPPVPSKQNDKTFGRQNGIQTFDGQVKPKDRLDCLMEGVNGRKSLRGIYDPKGGLKTALGEGNSVMTYGHMGKLIDSLAWARDFYKDGVIGVSRFDTNIKKNPVVDHMDVKVDRILNKRDVHAQNPNGCQIFMKKDDTIKQNELIIQKKGEIILAGEADFQVFKDYEKRRIKGHLDAPASAYDYQPDQSSNTSNKKASTTKNTNTNSNTNPISSSTAGIISSSHSLNNQTHPPFVTSLTKSKLPDKIKTMATGELIRDAGFNMVHSMKYGNFFRLAESEEEAWPLKTLTKPLGTKHGEKRFPIAPVSNVY